MSSWPIRVTSRPIYMYSEGPVVDLGKLGKQRGLSGEEIMIPAGSNVRVVEQLKYDERFVTRWLAKTTGKFSKPLEEGGDGIMRQWWGYIGKDDLEVYKPESKPVEPVSVSAL
jgi:hypothetical protein